MRNPLVDQWWFKQNEFTQQRLDDMRWSRSGLPELREFAARFPRHAAFVFGTGPSIEEVTLQQWVALSDFFSVGVNFFPYWLQQAHSIYTVPKLCYNSDRRRLNRKAGAPPRADQIAEGVWKCREAGGRSLCGYISYQYPHDWLIPIVSTPMWTPGYGFDLECGTPLSASAKIMFNRAVVAAIYVCAALGFPEIYLIGADHGPDCQVALSRDKTRSERPDEVNGAYEHYRDFLAEHGVTLMQCGKRNSVKSLKYKELEEVLDASYVTADC
jgi:hypothetical protein